jgi:hypothetical protein
MGRAHKKLRSDLKRWRHQAVLGETEGGQELVTGTNGGKHTVTMYAASTREVGYSVHHIRVTGARTWLLIME